MTTEEMAQMALELQEHQSLLEKIAQRREEITVVFPDGTIKPLVAVTGLAQDRPMAAFRVHGAILEQEITWGKAALLASGEDNVVPV